MLIYLEEKMKCVWIIAACVVAYLPEYNESLEMRTSHFELHRSAV